jgi:hypothetical protein
MKIPVRLNGTQKIPGMESYRLFTIDIQGKETTFSVKKNENVQKRAREVLKTYN